MYGAAETEFAADLPEVPFHVPTPLSGCQPPIQGTFAKLSQALALGYRVDGRE